MSRSLKPDLKVWRQAATIVLAAGWKSPGAAASSVQSAEDFRLLLLQRSKSQGFLPGAHVFPGGALDASDRSADWLQLFAPHHLPPRFGLGPAPAQRSAVPELPNSQPTSLPEVADGDAAALPDDVALRICAIREAFEEAGALLLRPRGVRRISESQDSAPDLDCSLEPPPDVSIWRTRVSGDARHFLDLCAQLDCTPNIWALHDWSGWLTPFVAEKRHRFDTSFYLCCLREQPPIQPDLTEVVDCQWLSPSEATKSFLSKEIWLAPPQFYEIRRLENFASLSNLHKFCLEHASERTERWRPVTCVTADGMIQLYPGDELYLEDSHLLEKVLSTEKKTEEIMKEAKKLHRLVQHSRHHYSIHVTIPSKGKHIYPKSYVVNKSHL
ncbi:nucleoside diphosphate-linked moiety X motif 19 [Fukomys damarensis]|uniref:Acyl-coenzyme A diphosphatase NUDT19 n=1 Tax=Fukomys damarensis TaxID=885580 RepID=A0A091DTL1_FUKDA|nr:nucleoside diphosphate-linked moiety X motif 19 [Fukomys damarensis]KFO26116.1 Nucleoside diphosphate-linked moiety X motif 19, mitochondrial [Fukomys damarensis]